VRIFESSREISESFLMLGGCLQKWLKFEGLAKLSQNNIFTYYFSII
jgi:hypothetical protein